MSMGAFETKYNLVMDAIENKLRTDSRVKSMQPPFTVERGSPTNKPQAYPILYILEGQISDMVWDTTDTVMTITFALDYYISSRQRTEGVADIRRRTLKLFDTLVGTITDRRLVVNGISLANGQDGVTIVNCDFGYFSPDETNNIIYKGTITVAVAVEVALSV